MIVSSREPEKKLPDGANRDVAREDAKGTEDETSRCGKYGRSRPYSLQAITGDSGI